MALSARIVDAQQTPDGGTWFTFEVFDPAEPDAALLTHAQGIAAVPERVPERRTRTVPRRKDDGSGDVVWEGGSPVTVEEEYDEMVETGRSLPPDAETIAEAIRNFLRDVAPLRQAEPTVNAGDIVDARPA